MKKYEITSEMKPGRFSSKLYRIKSCINFTTVSGHEVKKGDLGGWVEKEENLSQDGTAWIFDDAEVCGNAKILDSAVVCGNAKVFNDAEICGDVEVCGDAVISKNAYIFSLKHLMCVSPFPINGYPVNLTMFRTKEGEINIQFDHNPVKSIDEFKAFVDTFDDISDRLALITIVELGKRCIDLTA